MLRVAILLVVIAASAFYWYKRHIEIPALKKQRVKKLKPKVKAKKTAPEKSKFRCVITKAGTGACKPAQDLANLAILMDEASALPLKSCDAKKCSCYYQRYNDRRRDTRRSNSFISEGAMQNNKRTPQDRRLKTE